MDWALIVLLGLSFWHQLDSPNYRVRSEAYAQLRQRARDPETCTLILQECLTRLDSPRSQQEAHYLRSLFRHAYATWLKRSGDREWVPRLVPGEAGRLARRYLRGDENAVRRLWVFLLRKENQPLIAKELTSLLEPLDYSPRVVQLEAIRDLSLPGVVVYLLSARKVTSVLSVVSDRPTVFPRGGEPVQIRRLPDGAEVISANSLRRGKFPYGTVIPLQTSIPGQGFVLLDGADAWDKVRAYRLVGSPSAAQSSLVEWSQRTWKQWVATRTRLAGWQWDVIETLDRKVTAKALGVLLELPDRPVQEEEDSLAGFVAPPPFATEQERICLWLARNGAEENLPALCKAARKEWKQANWPALAALRIACREENPELLRGLLDVRSPLVGACPDSPTVAETARGAMLFLLPQENPYTLGFQEWDCPETRRFDVTGWQRIRKAR